MPNGRYLSGYKEYSCFPCVGEEYKSFCKHNVNLIREAKTLLLYDTSKATSKKKNSTLVQFRKASESKIQRNSHNNYSFCLILVGFPPRSYGMLFFSFLFAFIDTNFLFREF